MGGLRQYFHRLFNELLDNDRQNIYVFFYFEHNIEEMGYLSNERWENDSILLKKQEEIIDHLDKIDLYFCPFGAIWPRPVPRPSVVTLVDIQEKYYPKFFTAQDIWNREYHFEASTKTADQVITISEFSKNSIVHHHRISRNKVRTIYLAADESFYHPLKSEEKINLELPERFIFYPANRWFHKNHDNLLKALLILKKEYKVPVNCVLTGFDYEKNGYPLHEKIKEYELENQIKVIGYVSGEEVKYIYKKAEMLCFPSLFEGFGMPLVEAMITGCPVVCSHVTSMPEVVGKAALLFNPVDPMDIANKIHTLWNNSDLRRQLVVLGKEQAKKFSVKKVAASHLEVFDHAVQSYNKSRFLFFKYLYEPLHTYKMFRKKKSLENI
jgi:glycosyltransferase involved in cell wall biosynthesis